jgi:hypothetical protein
MLPMTAEVESTPGEATQHTVGVFTTRVVQRLSDGRQLVSHSRWHRKGLPPVQIGSDGTGIATPLVSHPWLRLWAPHRLTWWIAQLFIIGSACFALGGFASNWPQYSPAALAHSGVINTVFFIGSLFFTAAAWSQLLEAINGDVADIGTSSGAHHRDWRWFAWKPHNAGYSASLIQFIGTLLFNFNTADTMIAGLTAVEEDILIWSPDAIGSICFLVASYLALIEVSHRYWSFQPRQLSWWIVLLNLLGSVAFMLAAVFSFVLPSSGDAEWLWGANFFTLLGAVCFLVASYLMIPELFGAGRAFDTASSPPGNQSPKQS